MLGRVVPSQGSWKVQVGQVVSPTLFWGYIDHESHQESQGLSNADAFRLAELEHRMIDVFEQGDGADENFMPNLGSLVGVREQQSESWVRGRVVGLIKKNGGVEAKVFLVDYGHHLSVEAPKLRPLPDWALDMWPQVKLFQLYGLLPAQIIHCEETDKYEPRRSETWLPVVEGQVRQLLDAGIFLTFVPLRSKEQHILGELYVHGSNRESQSVNKYIHDRKYALYNADQFEKEHENGVKSLLEDLKEGFRGIDVLNIPANTVEKQKLLAEPAPHFVPMAARLPRKGADADQVNKPTLNMAKYREVFLRMTELEEQQTQQDSSEFSWGPSKLRRRQQAECKAQEALALDDDVSELSKQFADIFSTDGLDKSNKLCNVLVNAKNMPVLVLNFQQEKPISVISAAPFHTDVLKALEKSGFVAATNLQRYMWRAVARGRSVVAIGSHETGKTFGFAAPLASYLIYQAIPRSERNFNLFGPSVLIVCSSALKAEGLEDSLKKLVTDATINRQPVRRSDFSRVKICMINGEEELRKAAFSLLNGCHVLVTTMPAFESVALFCSGMALDLTKVKTVVLDDADILLVQYKKEVENMLALCEEESGSMENLQLVVTARQWTPELEAFTTSSMLATPVTIVASGFELLSFGHIRPHMHCITKMHASEADHEERIRFASTLLSARLGERRIIVCCRDFEETQRLHSSFGGSLEELIIVASSTENNAKVNAWRNQWHEMTVAGRQPLLITCDNVLPFLCISNADMIVHFSMAKSKHSFMLRHSAIMDSLQNGMHKPEVHLLLDANENEKQLLLLVEFQERMNANVPAVFEAKVKEMRAKMEKDRHLHILCPKVCAFGRCADFNLCAERHSLNETDKPAPFMPIQGEVKLQVAQVHDATHISARILEHKDELDQITTHSGNEHALLAMDMGEYFSDAEKRDSEESHQCLLRSKGRLLMLELEGNLFSCKDSLVHCVAKDMLMSGGIAVQFRQHFGGVSELLQQQRDVGEVAHLLLPDGRYIFCLVTKPKSRFCTPTLQALGRCLRELRRVCLEFGVTRIAMPRICCGNDRLQWTMVRDVIEKELSDSDLLVRVYNMTPEKGLRLTFQSKKIVQSNNMGSERDLRRRMRGSFEEENFPNDRYAGLQRSESCRQLGKPFSRVNEGSSSGGFGNRPGQNYLQREEEDENRSNEGRHVSNVHSFTHSKDEGRVLDNGLPSPQHAPNRSHHMSFSKGSVSTEGNTETLVDMNCSQEDSQLSIYKPVAEVKDKQEVGEVPTFPMVNSKLFSDALADTLTQDSAKPKSVKFVRKKFIA
ncbi:putative ATP-dependent RNA helicase TDRD12 isoform X2 [Neocloeon triangulifer]|uniref:putative ATP-dependent RNA helicase TDRD12 isoform X2 n=1 Tax=Neocloeon triangulifer TaxID=2078957 RepID=UPI00286F7631|nr:putative ATP-dependent RNA helicase TDRD12 isoform X2 [Neocloeon triangulifer]